MLCNENKGADQLRSYCEADLHLCFRIGKNHDPAHSKTGVYWSIEFVLFLIQNNRLWTLIRTAGKSVLTCTYNQCFEQNDQKFCNEIFNFTAEKDLYIARTSFLIWYLPGSQSSSVFLTSNGNSM